MAPSERWIIVRERMDRLGQWYRAMWIGDDGSLRVGVTDDMRQMLIDLNIPERL